VERKSFAREIHLRSCLQLLRVKCGNQLKGKKGKINNQIDVEIIGIKMKSAEPIAFSTSVTYIICRGKP